MCARALKKSFDAQKIVKYLFYHWRESARAFHVNGVRPMCVRVRARSVLANFFLSKFLNESWAFQFQVHRHLFFGRAIHLCVYYPFFYVICSWNLPFIQFDSTMLSASKPLKLWISIIFATFPTQLDSFSDFYGFTLLFVVYMFRGIVK